MRQIQNKYVIAWQGAVEALHSLALVNRAICARLARRGHRVTHEGRGVSGEGRGVSDEGRGAGGEGVDCVVGHQWPPDFRRPASGRWVVMQPWEFGSIPRAWLEPLRRDVDELWVNCGFVRDCYVAAGMPPSKVHVIPLGVDPAAYAVPARPYPLRTTKGFRFLFVGGTLYRKGSTLCWPPMHGRSRPGTMCVSWSRTWGWGRFIVARPGTG